MEVTSSNAVLSVPPVPGTDEQAAVYWGCKAWCAVVELRWCKREHQEGAGIIQTGTKQPGACFMAVNVAG